MDNLSTHEPYERSVPSYLLSLSTAWGMGREGGSVPDRARLQPCDRLAFLQRPGLRFPMRFSSWSLNAVVPIR